MPLRCSITAHVKQRLRMRPKPCCKPVTTPSPSLFLAPFIGKTSGIWHAHLDRQTSWARTVCCRRRGGYGRRQQEPASAGSWSARQCTSGSRQSAGRISICRGSELAAPVVEAAGLALGDIRCSWQWLDGWRRPATCDHRHGRGRGCRHRL
jgi:hypothetical protein